ncbi:MAG: Rrf2 family transcriptional regulator [Candidatus Omnitrophica bacterium]|nr:Rrf2 family transcriptional regulator [Candidatus Omnitrophota bacterium]
MRFTTRTEYGLVCLVYMARHPEAAWITIREIAEKEHYPVAYTEKILQSLKHANLVASHHGSQGGYVLARDPSRITLKEIVEALEGGTFEVFCEPEAREEIVCTHFCMCGVKPIWRMTKELLDKFFSSITLEMLAGKEKQVEDRLQELVGSIKQPA